MFDDDYAKVRSQHLADAIEAYFDDNLVNELFDDLRKVIEESRDYHHQKRAVYEIALYKLAAAQSI